MNARIRLARATVITLLAWQGAAAATTFIRVPGETISPPSADSHLNRVLSDRAGNLMMAWDDTASGNTFLQMLCADPACTNRVHAWQPIVPVSPGENTRILLTAPDRVLWGSTERWLLLDKVDGTVVTNGTWSFPALEPSEVVVRGDLLLVGSPTYSTITETVVVGGHYEYEVVQDGGVDEEAPAEAPSEPVDFPDPNLPPDVQSAPGESGGQTPSGGGAESQPAPSTSVRAVYVEDTATVERQVRSGTVFAAFDTNMTQVATVNSSLDLGTWEAVEGTWLVDRSQRTRPVLRYATLSDALEPTGIREVSLMDSEWEGFVEHRVLGAEPDRLVVVSTLEKTPATRTVFSIVDRAGNLLWRRTYTGSQHITASAMSERGWLLSGIDFSQASTPQFLWLLTYRGWAQQKQYYYDSQSWEFILHNTDPARLIHHTSDNQVAVYELRVEHDYTFWDWLEELLNGWLGEAFAPPTATAYWDVRTAPPIAAAPPPET